jgi:hypothetical protein
MKKDYLHTTKEEKLHVMELFAGIGGGILGHLLCAVPTRKRIVCAVELDSYCRSVLIYPYKNELFRTMLKSEGCHLNSGMIFGGIDTFITVIEHALNIRKGIWKGTPRAGIAQMVHDDSSTRRMMQSDQFAYQIASIYYPQYFRLDTERYLLSWVGILNRPIAEVRSAPVGYCGIGEASLIHSSSTIHFGSQQMWDNWVTQNILNLE